LQCSECEGEINMILNPSCSTIVCRVPIYERGKFNYGDGEEFSTDMYPNGAINSFIEKIKEMKNNGLKNIDVIPDLEFVDNEGGGGHWDYVEKSWQIAQLYGAGILSEEKAMELDDDAWCKGTELIMMEKCQKCFEEYPKKECENIVKRLVGECKGIFKKTIFDYIEEQYIKLQEDE
jgi:hypothetical protein